MNEEVSEPTQKSDSQSQPALMPLDATTNPNGPKQPVDKLNLLMILVLIAVILLGAFFLLNHNQKNGLGTTTSSTQAVAINPSITPAAVITPAPSADNTQSTPLIISGGGSGGSSSNSGAGTSTSSVLSDLTNNYSYYETLANQQLAVNPTPTAGPTTTPSPTPTPSVLGASCGSTIIWTGSTSTAWNVVGNWDVTSNRVPCSADDVIIPAGTTRQPTLDLGAGSVTIRSLDITGVSSGSLETLTLSNGSATNQLMVTTNVSVNNYGRITHFSNSGTGSVQTHILAITTGGDFSISANGLVDVSARGFSAGNGPGVGFAAANSNYGGGGYGGAGGDSLYRGSIYGSVKQPVDIGSGAGQGGIGGGAIRLSVGGTFTNNNASATPGVNANGGSGTAGGSGGSVWISAHAFGGTAPTGTITANGGPGLAGGGYVYGGGGGGRVALYTTTGSITTTQTANGGTSANGAPYGGGGGTVFTSDSGSINGNLVIGSPGAASTIIYPTFPVTSGSSSEIYDSFSMSGNSCQYTVPNGFTLTVTGNFGFTNSGTNYLVNNGTITGSGSTTMSSPNLSLNNAATGIISGVSNITAGAGFANAGTISGATNLTAGTTFTNTGSISDVSTISLPATTLSNSGTIAGSYTLSRSNTFTNNGTMSGLTALTINALSFINNGALGSGNGPALFVDGASAVFQSGTTTPSTALNLSSLTIKNGGKVNHTANTTTQAYTLNLNVSGSVSIDSNAASGIDVSGKGFSSGGPGAGNGVVSSAYGGGAYGGAGGNAGYGGNSYGNVKQPTDIGSNSFDGARGGGAVKLTVGDTFTNDNATSGVNANGTQGQGGGSGGGIWISARVFVGVGKFTSKGAGAAATYNSGAGGGGRIALYAATGSAPDISLINANGGTSGSGAAYAGGGGSIYISDSTTTNGNLTIASPGANNSSVKTSNQPGANETYDTFTLSDLASYTVPSGRTLNVGTLTLTPATVNYLNNNGTINGNGTSTAISSATLKFTNTGTITGITALSLSSLSGTNAGTIAGSYTFTTNYGFNNSGNMSGLTSLSITAGTFTNSGTLGSGNGAALSVAGAGSTFSSATTNTVNLSSVSVTGGGKLTHSSTSAGDALTYSLNLNVSGNVTIDSTSSINVNSDGYKTGPGLGNEVQDNAGNYTPVSTGGSYGSVGGGSSISGGAGCAASVSGPATYGSASAPVDLGSGGANPYGGSTPGGGAVKLTVGGTLNVAGTITANGSVGYPGGIGPGGGGGSGGSIWLTAGAITGSGSLSAAGGAGGNGNGTGGIAYITPCTYEPGGFGGGGRIALYSTAPTVSTVTPAGGSTAGGTPVVITGSGFATGDSVKLGGTAATGVTVVNPTTINAVSSAHAAGLVNTDVAVTAFPGTITGAGSVVNTTAVSTTLANSYTYATSTIASFYFATAPASGAVGAASTVFTVGVKDVFGNVINAPGTTTVYLYSSGTGGTFSTTSGGTYTSALSITIPSGNPSANFFYKNSNTAAYTLTASDSTPTPNGGVGVVDATTPYTVNAAAPTVAVLTPASQSVTAGSASSLVTLTTQDSLGNPSPVVSNTSFALSSTGVGGQFATDSGFTNIVTSVTVNSGASTATFYYRNNTAGSYTLTAHAASGFSDGTATVTVNPAAIASYYYATAPTSGAAGSSSTVFTVGAHDAFGNVVTVGSNQVVYLYSSAPSGTFSNTTNAGPFTATSTTITTGNTTADFYYKNNSTSGSPYTLTASDNSSAPDGGAGIVDVTTSYAVNAASASVAVLTPSTQSVAAGVVTSAITLTTQDSLGNVAAVAGNTNFMLSSSGSGGQFSVLASPFTPVSTVTVNGGSSSTTFFYKNNTAGSYTLTAHAASGFSDGTASVNVNPAAISSYYFATAPATGAVNSASTAFAVGAKDVFGNVITVGSNTTVYLYSTSGTGTFATSSGGPYTATSTVIPTGNTTGSFYYKDSVIGSYTLTGSDNSSAPDGATGIVDATTGYVVSTAPITKFVFAPSSASVAAGSPTSALTITSEDASSNPTNAPTNLTLTLSDGGNGGQFSLTSSPFTPVSTATITSGTNNVVVYYRNNTAGAYTLTAHDAGYTDASATVTVNSAAIASYYFLSAPTSANISVASGAFIVGAHDVFGNVVTVGSNTTVYLYSTAATGTFSNSGSGGPYTATSVVITNGNATATFYYKDPIANPVTITASDQTPTHTPDTGVVDANTAFTVFNPDVVVGPNMPIPHRSATLDDSRPGDPNVHFSWNSSSVNTIKGIRIQVCTDGLANTACTTPTGADLSTATLTSTGGQLGASGWSITTVVSTHEILITNSVGAATTVGGTSTLDLANFTNPTSIGTFFFRISTYTTTTAAPGDSVGYGAIGTSTNRSLTQTVDVAEALVFRVANSVASDCSSQTDIADPNDAASDLVTLSPQSMTMTSTSIGTAQMCATSNAQNGYTITYYDAALGGATKGFYNGAHEFPSTNQFTSATGTEQFGFNLRANTTPAVGFDPDGNGLVADLTNANYSTVDRFSYNDTGSSTILAQKSSPNAATARYTLSYIANISSTTQGGTYKARQVFVITATY